MTKKNIVKSGEEDASSPLTSLPDEIILQILNKITDLKTLCFCYLVSRSFSLIVPQVDAISFTVPLINPPIPEISPTISLFYGESFKSANRFLDKFKGVKGLCIELPSSREIGNDNPCLCKWMVNFGNRIESFMFLSPNSIFDMDGVCLNGNGDEEVISGRFKQNFHISFQYLKEAIAWHTILLYLIRDFPKLEKVSITDSGRRGRLSLSGEKLRKVKEWVQSASETKLYGEEIPDIVSNGYVPVLKLPVSGYVMKGVYFGIMGKHLEAGCQCKYHNHRI